MNSDMASDIDVWIDTVIARSGELRKAGVLSIGANGFSAQLSAYVEPIAVDRSSPADDEPDFTGDPLNDPASYLGGNVPGFQIEKFRTDYEE